MLSRYHGNRSYSTVAPANVSVPVKVTFYKKKENARNRWEVKWKLLLRASRGQQSPRSQAASTTAFPRVSPW